MAEIITATASSGDPAVPSLEEPLVPAPATDAPPAGTPPEAPPAVPPAPPAEPTPVDLDGAAQEFIESGEFTEETLRGLEAKGFTKEQATRYAKGVQAEAQQITTKLAERAGGQDALQSMQAWAKTSLPEAEQKAFNALVMSGDEGQMAFAIDGLKARYTAALGDVGTKLNGQAAAREQAVKPFASQAEIIQAMSDPRYAKDSAYQAAVMERLRESTVLNTRVI